MARMKDLLIDATNAGKIDPDGPEFADRDTCQHPPARNYAWRAHDGTLVVCCCECGKVLQGEAQPAEAKAELDTIAANLARLVVRLINALVAQSKAPHKAQYVLETLIADLESRV